MTKASNTPPSSSPAKSTSSSRRKSTFKSPASKNATGISSDNAFVTVNHLKNLGGDVKLDDKNNGNQNSNDMSEKENVLVNKNDQSGSSSGNASQNSNSNSGNFDSMLVQYNGPPGTTGTPSQNFITPNSKKSKKQTQASSSSSKLGSRDESSLKQLTKKFVELVSGSVDGTLDLNNAAVHLNVPKRRIYDITNVLEGIGLITKKTKNIIQWRGGGNTTASSAEINFDDNDENEEIRQFQKEIKDLQNEMKDIEKKTQEEHEKLKFLSSDEAKLNYAYVSTADIKRIQMLKDRTIIAVRAPSGTTLTVPDPDEGMPANQRRFQIFLHSIKDPIHVFLLPDAGEASSFNEEDQELAQTPPRHTEELNIKTPPSHSYQSPDPYSIRQLSPPKPEPDYIYSENKFSVQELYE